jgi:predicted GNAT superfamily acetyltransferase
MKQRFDDDAAEAAARAGVRIALAHSLADLHEVSRVLADVWSTPLDRSPGEISTLAALAHTNGYVAAAWKGDTVVGGSFGFVTWQDGVLGLHSHATGTTSADRGVGAAMKLHQRAWAAENDIAQITWTFDPLLRRNARFNLEVLGARIVGYEPNFYGPMSDAFNTNEETDRCFVSWDVQNAVLRRALFEPDDECQVVLAHNVGGTPLLLPFDFDANRVLIEIPDDVIAMRTSAPEMAQLWRLAVRETIQLAFRRGLHIARLTAAGFYVAERDPR